MANLKETPVWEVGVYQWETSDPVLGGENGIDNVPTRQLANRTLWLKNEISTSISEIGTKKADKATTLAGYGITNAYTSTATDNLLANKVDKTVTIGAGSGLSGGGNLASSRTLAVDFASAEEAKAGVVANKSIHPSTLAAAAYAAANNRYDGSLTSGDANDLEVGTRYLCSNAVLNTPNANTWWDGTYSFIETKYSHFSGQKIQIAWGYERANLAIRTFAVNVWSNWRPAMGADWTSTGVDGVRNKPTTVAGFGLTDVYTKSQSDNLLNAKAAKATTLSGYGITDAYTITQSDAFLNAKAAKATTLGGYGITDGATKKELLTIPVTTDTLPETIAQPLSLVTITASDGLKNHSGFTYVRTTQYGGVGQWSQLASPYTSAAAPKLYGRHSYQGTDSPWGRFDGGDWSAGPADTGYIDNKPISLLGYGITDWVVSTYGGASNVIANAVGNGIHSYGSAGTDAPTWSDGISIGALKMIQMGTAAWDSQIAIQAYGEGMFIRSRRTANGAYQPWKRVDGADWTASEKTAGFIANKPTTITGFGITDAVTTNTSQTITGGKTFSDTTGFLSAKSVGFSSWQDTVRLNGTLPAISNGSIGIGFHAANRVVYFMDITNQTYLAHFNFDSNTVSVTGSFSASNGFVKGGIETAYQNVNFAAGLGLTGGGTLASNRSFAVDKASAADADSGTLNKVITADILKPMLDAASPSGTITFLAGSTTPSGWLKANGTAVSRTTYAGLFAAIGTTYGTGNGTTTFNLPDLRGQFPRFLDDGANIDTGRVLGSKQEDAIRNITGAFSGTTGATPSGAFLGGSSMKGSLYEGTSNQRMVTFDASRMVPTASENRPVNIALIGLIKT